MAETDSRSVCVYCASSSKVPQIYQEAAFKLGGLLADAGLRLITGGGKFGLMRQVEDGAMQHGGHVTAVIPGFMVDNGWLHPDIKDVVTTDGMHARKRFMAETAGAVIALPGGCGTLDELFEVLTWKQLGLFTRHIIILNVGGFYDNLLKQLQHSIDEEFMRPEHSRLWAVASTPEEALELLETLPQWDSTLSKLAR